MSQKIAFIIQARMQSERLPGKVMKPLPLVNGKPLLGWIIDTLRSAALPQKNIIVASSKHPANDEIEHFCQAKGISCYRGAENDVLSRFQEIAQKGNYETVLRFTADNPFLDVDIIKDTICYHQKGNYDYTCTSGTPLGMIVEVIKAIPLLRLKKYELSAADKEHVTLYLKRNDNFKKGLFKLNLKKELKDLRLTVDYPSDFLLASTLCDFSLQNNKLKGLPLIETILKTYPWIFKANAENFQKLQFDSLQEEIIYAYKILRKLDLERASQLLRK